MSLKCEAKISVFVCVSVIIWSLYLIGVVDDRWGLRVDFMLCQNCGCLGPCLTLGIPKKSTGMVYHGVKNYPKIIFN